MEDKGDARESQRHKQKQLLQHKGRSLTLETENAFTNKCKNVKESCQGQRLGLRCGQPSQTHSFLPTIARPQMDGHSFTELSSLEQKDMRRVQFSSEFTATVTKPS